MNKKLLRLEIEKKAAQFRSENGFSGTETINLTSLLIKKNVITIFRPLSSALSGMAIKAGDNLRFMMVNQNHNLGRQNFTIGHELYHLFIQENFTSQKCVTGLFEKQADIEEQKADVFSAALLLPEAGLTLLVPDKELSKKNQISADTLFKIQHYFGVSMKCVIYRLWELEVIGPGYFDQYATGIKSQAKRMGYGTALYETGNADRIIGDYGSLATQLYKEQKISESHYIELMNAINVDPFAIAETDD